jgi:SAM-dependent methyltransferase
VRARGEPARKVAERRHGTTIAPRALEVWGWQTPAGQLRAHRRIGLLAEAAAIAEGTRVLELGCGTGLFTRGFAGRGARVTALDISLDLLLQARRGEDMPARLVLGDAERLPFRGGCFDAVVGSSVLHHLEPLAALRETHRVLAPGGRVAFAEPNMLNPQIALQKNVPFIKRACGDSPDETAFFRWQARRLLREAGFAQTGVLPHEFLHPATPVWLLGVVRRVSALLERVPLLREIAGSLLFWGVRETPAPPEGG